MQDIPPTPVQTLKEAKRIAIEEGIKHVYLGNV
jgi:pyruvate formate lyase activating enzyme